MNTIEEGLVALRAGKMLVLVDDEDRENEGDVYIPAQFATPEAVNFMARHACGLICVPMEEARLADLSMGQMVQNNTDNHCTAFTVSVDHRDTTTGISAHERSYTIKKLIDSTAKGEDFRRPGHVFPLAARDGGVLVRAGHTEAAVDLSRLCRMPGDNTPPAGVICEIMNSDGTMARMAELLVFAEKHGLCIISIEDLIRYRRENERLVAVEAETFLPTRYGNFRLTGYREIYTGKEHLALVMGNISDGEPVLCRVHSECLTGDALGSSRCDCGEQYEEAMRRIAEEGRGVLVYLRQEGRGIGLINKLKAYALQDRGLDTVDANIHLGFPADMRDYQIGVQILQDLGVHTLKLMTNNPSKIEGLEKYGIKIVERISIRIKANKYNELYQQTKDARMNHLVKETRQEGREAI